MAKQKGRKRPGVDVQPGAKRPTTGSAVTVDAIKHEPLTWGLKRVDFNGDWGWLQLEGRDVADLHRELAAMEGETLHDLLRRSKTKGIPAEHMRQGAKDRLATLRLEERDTLWELRLNSKRRAWGLVEGSVFHFLWWDPDETACNPPPKGTKRR
jgi:hypothetical protein